MNEIQTIFRAFNPSLSGYIDISTFERMCHSLGFRVEQSEIQERILRLANIHIEVGANNITSAPSDERNMHQIDLSMAARLLSQLGYAHRNIDDEMKMYFRLFDVGNKGYVTVDDLRQFQVEVTAFDRKDNGDGEDVAAGAMMVVGGSSLKAMIDQFDVNHDGVIDYDEFKNLLSPILSLSSLTE